MEFTSVSCNLEVRDFENESGATVSEEAWICSLTLTLKVKDPLFAPNVLAGYKWNPVHLTLTASSPGDAVLFNFSQEIYFVLCKDAVQYGGYKTAFEVPESGNIPSYLGSVNMIQLDLWLDFEL